MKLADVTGGWLGEREVSLLFSTDEVISYGRNVYSARGDLEAVLILNIHTQFINGFIKKEKDIAYSY